MFAILGAAGKVGRATIRRLAGSGAPLRAIVRDAARADDLRACGCEIAVADLRDAAALTAALDGVAAAQVICPVAARDDDALQAMRGVVDSIRVALTATRPESILAISDYGAEVPEGTGVTLAFHYMEEQLRRIPASLTFLRSAEHMQNWSRLFRRAADTGILPSFHHPTTKLFPTVSAADVGALAADLLGRPAKVEPPRVVYIEGPRRYTTEDVATMMTQITGHKVLAHAHPRSDWDSALVGGGLSRSYADLVAELYDAHNAGRIDVAAGRQDVRKGTTELFDVLLAIAPRSRAPK